MTSINKPIGGFVLKNTPRKSDANWLTGAFQDIKPPIFDAVNEDSANFYRTLCKFYRTLLTVVFSIDTLHSVTRLCAAGTSSVGLVALTKPGQAPRSLSLSSGFIGLAQRQSQFCYEFLITLV
jgi:hypothetical protein